jgi:hypothetical protein
MRSARVFAGEVVRRRDFLQQHVKYGVSCYCGQKKTNPPKSRIRPLGQVRFFDMAEAAGVSPVI